MKRKIIISVAPVQAGKPVDAAALAKDVEKCAQAGASMCHLHSRLPDGTLSPDTSYMCQCFDAILKRTDLIVQVSTGGVSKMNIEQRCRVLDYPKARSASLNAGSTNLGDGIYINSFDDIAYCAQAVYDRGIIPDVEVFDIGMISNIERTARDIPFRHPIFYNLVFGHKGGMPATMDSLIAFRSMVPKDACWGVTHYGREGWDFLAAAIALGAKTVRIGFEDSDWLDENSRAVQNHPLVEHLAAMIRSMGLEPATPAQAKELMGIRP